MIQQNSANIFPSYQISVGCALSFSLELVDSAKTSWSSEILAIFCPKLRQDNVWSNFEFRGWAALRFRPIVTRKKILWKLFRHYSWIINYQILLFRVSKIYGFELQLIDNARGRTGKGAFEWLMMDASSGFSWEFVERLLVHLAKSLTTSLIL